MHTQTQNVWNDKEWDEIESRVAGVSEKDRRVTSFYGGLNSFKNEMLRVLKKTNAPSIEQAVHGVRVKLSSDAFTYRNQRTDEGVPPRQRPVVEGEPLWRLDQKWYSTGVRHRQEKDAA